MMFMIPIPRRQQRDRTHQGHSPPDCSGKCIELRNQRVVGKYLKIILRTRRNLPRRPQDAADLLDGVLVARLIAGLDQNAQAAPGSPKTIQRGAQGITAKLS
jgi:hypothetical protein